MASFHAKIGLERMRKREKKIFVLFRSYLMRYRKFRKKLQKNWKNTIMASFKARIG